MSLNHLIALGLLSTTFTLSACDPEKDSDGDGLTDKMERELGTDKNEVDSDGDGYTDGAEYDAGSDPADAEDVVYEGGWPVQSADFKDGLEGDFNMATMLGRYTMVDQFGDSVDIYDFAGQGKTIVWDVSAEWCGPCQGLAAALDGLNPSHPYAQLLPAIEAGDVYFITILEQDMNGAPATQATNARWFSSFSNEHIPVLADSTGLFAQSVGVSFFPTLFATDENFNVIAFDFDATLAAAMNSTMQ